MLLKAGKVLERVSGIIAAVEAEINGLAGVTEQRDAAINQAAADYIRLNGKFPVDYKAPVVKVARPFVLDGIKALKSTLELADAELEIEIDECTVAEWNDLAAQAFLESRVRVCVG